MRHLLTSLIAPAALALGLAATPAAGAWEAGAAAPPTVDAADPARVVLAWQLPSFTVTGTLVDGHAASLVDLPGYALRREAGRPELPVVTATIPVPGSGRVRLEVVAVGERAIPVAPVLPSLGHLTRSADPADTARTWGPGYAAGEVWPPAVAELGRPFLLGDRRGVTVRLYPLRYDAGRGLLLVAERLELVVVTEGSGGVNEAPVATVGVAPALAPVADRLFTAGAAPAAAKAFTTGERPGRLLVVTAPEFVDAVAPLVAWKTRRGIETEIVTVKDLGGSAAAVAAAVADRWRGAGLDWVLLVGDREWVPTLAGTFDGSDSDVRYALVAGDDLVPDLFVSRVPARSAADVAVQVAKFVAYESQPLAGAAAAGYDRAAGIASNEGSPADDARADLLRTDLLAAGFAAVDQLYQRSGAGAADVRAALADGRSLVNYLGHGTGTGWTSVPFGLADVAALDNAQWPWIVDVSCDNGGFARTTCFAEAWLRAGTVAAPAGAIAVVAASSLVPWTPPTVMQAEIVDALTTGSERTLGALHAAGLARVADIYGGLPVAAQVIEQFNLFGDASLQVRTRPAGSFAVTAPAAVAAGDAGFPVTVTGPAGAVVAVSAGSVLYARGTVGDGGQADVRWLRTSPAGAVLDLTVTGPEMAPWLGTVAVSGGLASAPDVVAGGARLLGNHPNPFNPATTIAYSLESAGRVNLTVHDLAGRRVRTLVAEDLPAGRHDAVWDGRDDGGKAVGSGVYLYRLSSAGGSAAGRMTLVK
ncbi:MAG: C25 family cysteine peptidase [Candidatus Krumholzibacteriia bacterium]